MKKQSKSLKINTPLFISNHYKDIENYTYNKKEYSIMSVVRNNQLEHYLVTKKEDKDFLDSLVMLTMKLIKHYKYYFKLL